MTDRSAFRTKWLAPLIFFELYLSATVLLFFFGPWQWTIQTPVRLAFYLIAAQAFIGVGYLVGWRAVSRIRSAAKVDAEELNSGISYLKRALVVTFVLLIPTAMSRTGELFPNIFAGINDPGAVYNQSIARLEDGNSFVVVEYLRMLLSPCLVGVYPLTVVYWSRLPPKMKLFCLVVITFNLSLYLATGTNKGFADFIITLPWLIFLGISAGVLKIRIHRSVLVIGIIILFAVFLLFFGAGQLQREGGVGELGVINVGADLLYADDAHFISRLLPRNLQIIFESLTRYLGQGYYALSMTFDIAHNSTMGFGNSMFIARNADVIFGTTHFTAGSLPGLLEAQTGWGMFTSWHSIYPWLASDFGFIGALFVLGILAYLFALSWGRSLISLAPKWIILCYLLLILFFYIPGNNQVFQTGETWFAFFILLIGILVPSGRLHHITLELEYKLLNRKS